MFNFSSGNIFSSIKCNGLHRCTTCILPQTITCPECASQLCSLIGWRKPFVVYSARSISLQEIQMHREFIYKTYYPTVQTLSLRTNETQATLSCICSNTLPLFANIYYYRRRTVFDPNSLRPCHFINFLS